MIELVGAAAAPMLGRAAGAVVGKRLSLVLTDRKARQQAEEACGWAFLEWLRALAVTLQERGADEGWIEQVVTGHAAAVERFFTDEAAIEELLRPFTELTDQPQLDGGLLVGRWHALGLPQLPAEFDAARACRWYVEALTGKRQALELLRGHWQAQTAAHRNQLLEQMRGPWAEWNLDAYARAMRDWYQVLDISTLEMTQSQDLEAKPIRLSDIFIPQDARRSRPRRSLPRDYMEALRKHAARGDGEALAEVLGDDAGLDSGWDKAKREPFFDILSASDVQHLVVLGDPGAGKSCLARMMALGLLEGFGGDANADGKMRPWLERMAGHLPLLIELRKFVAWEAKGGRDGVLGYLHHLGNEHGFGLNQADLDRKLKDSASLVMFDGLDEIVDAAERDTMADRIVGFARLYARTRVVVTARVAGFDQRPFVLRASGFTIVTLDELSPKQIERFSETWFRLTLRGNDAVARQRHAHLIDSVKTRPQLAALAGNPLLLTILAIVARGRELPGERAKLYDHALRVFCHQWDFQRNVQLPDDSPLKCLEEDDKLKLLRRIAWSMVEGDSLSSNAIDRDDLEAAVCAYFKAEWWADDLARCKTTARQMIEVLEERNYVLCRQGAGRLFGFVHRTFLEYLAAAQLCWRIEKDRDLAVDELCQNYIMPNATKDSWQEIIRLLVGQLQPTDSARVLDVLVDMPIIDDPDFPGHRTAPALVLAIECLAEFRARDRRHLAGARQTIWRRTVQDNLGRFRWTIIDVLGQQVGNDAEIRQLLIERSSEDGDEGVRRHAIWALGSQIGSDTEIRQLLLDRGSNDDHYKVRKATIWMLGEHVGSDPDIQQWLLDRARIDPAPKVRAVAIENLASQLGNNTKILRPVIECACEDNDTSVRRAALRALCYALDEASVAVLLSLYLDGRYPGWDPREPINNERVAQAAHKLQMSEGEVRARYEAIAAELPLRLAWREGAAA